MQIKYAPTVMKMSITWEYVCITLAQTRINQDTSFMYDWSTRTAHSLKYNMNRFFFCSRPHRRNCCRSKLNCFEPGCKTARVVQFGGFTLIDGTRGRGGGQNSARVMYGIGSAILETCAHNNTCPICVFEQAQILSESGQRSFMWKSASQRMK